MAIDAFSAVFGDLDIFRGLAPQQIGAIARSAERMMFRPGQTIITAGASGDAAYVIIGGETVALTDDIGSEVAIVPGTLVGEMAMLIEHEYRVSVVARASVKALKLTRNAMHDLMQKDPRLAEHFVARVSSRLTRVAVELRRIDETLALAGDMATFNPGRLPSNGPQPHL